MIVDNYGILETIDKVRAKNPNAKKIVVYGTQETLDRVNKYLPSDISTQVLPECFMAEDKEDSLYVIPILDPIDYI